MLDESVRNMVKRSMPRPQPPVGGRPYSRALQKVSSISCASSSPAALSYAWVAINAPRRQYIRSAGGSLTSQATYFARTAHLGLVGKPLALGEGVVQLGVRVAQLLLAHEKLETLGQAGYAPVAACLAKLL